MPGSAELVLMVLDWIRPAFVHGGGGDFPGRYWFAVLPMVTAAAVLHVRSRTLRRPKFPSGHPFCVLVA